MIRHIFKTSTWHPTELEWLRAANTLSQPERERISQFMYKRDAKQSMAGRLLMRSCFTQLSGEPPESFHLSRDESGKPFIVNPPASLASLSFNVSHAGDYAAFAASTSAKIGVDVMKIELRRNTTVQQFFGHMKKQFTDFEWQNIRSAPTERGKLANFYRHWCLKESYVKAIGTGLKFGLQRIQFDLGALEDGICTSTTVSVDGVVDLDWKFEEILVDNHFVAVAVGDGKFSDENSVSIELLGFNDLAVSEDTLGDKFYFVNFNEKKECP